MKILSESPCKSSSPNPKICKILKNQHMILQFQNFVHDITNINWQKFYFRLKTHKRKKQQGVYKLS